jgi:hypothetical protein
MNSEVTTAVTAAPPATVSGLLILGVSLDTWVLIATGIYTVLALWALVRDKYIHHYWRKDK